MDTAKEGALCWHFAVESWAIQSLLWVRKQETAPLSFPSFLRGTQEYTTCPAPSGDSESRAEAALRSEQMAESADPHWCVLLPHLTLASSAQGLQPWCGCYQKLCPSAVQVLSRAAHIPLQALAPTQGDSCSFDVQVRFVLMLSQMPCFSSLQLSMTLLCNTTAPFWTAPGYPDRASLLGWLVPLQTGDLDCICYTH